MHSGNFCLNLVAFYDRLLGGIKGSYVYLQLMEEVYTDYTFNIGITLLGPLRTST